MRTKRQPFFSDTPENIKTMKLHNIQTARKNSKTAITIKSVYKMSYDSFFGIKCRIRQ